MASNKVESEPSLKNMPKRKHYRLGCLWNISYQEFSEEEKEEGNWRKGVTTDVSGGGCRFNSKERQRAGNHLLIKIHMGEEVEDFVFQAKVLSSAPLQNGCGAYENRVEFLGLSFLEQERFIRQIFEEKRKVQLQERSSLHEKKYFDY